MAAFLIPYAVAPSAIRFHWGSMGGSMFAIDGFPLE
jgi:hypothetical protein